MTALMRKMTAIILANLNLSKVGFASVTHKQLVSNPIEDIGTSRSYPLVFYIAVAIVKIFR